MDNNNDIEDSNLNHDVEIEQVLRPKLFTDFEGQDQIVDNLKVFIEAASSFGWHKYANENDLIISIDKFGESGKGEDLFEHFGFSSKKIYKQIKDKVL